MSEFTLVAEGTHVEQFFGNRIVKDKITVEESVIGLVYGRDERVGRIKQKWQMNISSTNDISIFSKSSGQRS